MRIKKVLVLRRCWVTHRKQKHVWKALKKKHSDDNQYYFDKFVDESGAKRCVILKMGDDKHEPILNGNMIF